MSFVDKSNTCKVHFTETLNFKIISTTGQSATRKSGSRWKCALGEKNEVVKLRQTQGGVEEMMAVFDPIRTKVITHP